MQIENATSLRNNLYKVLDKVVKTGTPIEFERKGKKLQIISGEEVNKFANLVPHSTIVGDPEDLIDSPSSVWQEPDNL